MPQKVFASIGNAFLRISSKPFIETTSIYIPIPAIKMFLLYDGAYTSTNVSCYSSELSMDLFVAGRDQSAADQPNNLAEGHPPL